MANGWTPERRAKQSEQIKSWKPWEKSTGAKTHEGKNKSKMNALKHGCRSEVFRKFDASMADYNRMMREIENDIINETMFNLK